MVEMHPVSSSDVHSVGYDENARELHVKFQSGRTYAYEGVLPHVFQIVKSADSVGGHIHSHIKPTYPARRVS